ncbi:MAG: hypothetical protein V8R92_02155 [Eubacterium sp.]
MSFLNITFCYNFIVMDKALFLHTQHEFEFDSEALEVCRNEDVDCVVLYLGMNTVM